MQHKFPCGLWRDPWLSRLSPSTHGSHMEQISTLQPVEEPPVEQVAVSWRRLWPMERLHRSRPRAGAAVHGEDPTQEQGFGGSCCPWGTRDGADLEELLTVGSPCKISLEVWHPGGGTPLGAGAESECGGAAETKLYRLTAAPIPSSFPCTSWR